MAGQKENAGVTGPRPEPITSIPLRYTHETAEMEGTLFLPSAPRGAVLLVHEFTGPGEYMFSHARRLADAGYIAFVCDMYGRSIRPATRDEASTTSRIYRNDRLLMRERVRAAFSALSRHSAVQGLAVAAIGFSFGGCAVLELARSGAPVAGVCSVYGYLQTTHPVPASTHKELPCGPILVLHGAHDKVVPLADVPPFVEEMRNAHMDCRTILYADAGHGFCHEGLVRNDTNGSWYCPRLAERAWQDIFSFLETAYTTERQGTADTAACASYESDAPRP